MVNFCVSFKENSTSLEGCWFGFVEDHKLCTIFNKIVDILMHPTILLWPFERLKVTEIVFLIEAKDRICCNDSFSIAGL